MLHQAYFGVEYALSMNVANLEAITHLEQLKLFIHQEMIKSGGSLSFARFMELALYAPALGYYSAGWHKLGPRGDFVTAPEISPLFAKCVARQSQSVLNTMHNKDILELGAGTGVFAKDLLLELKKLNSLPDRYLILEISADLRERQKQCLTAYCPELLSRVIWLDSLEHVEITGLILANEVMDALPVHCFFIENQTVKERSVTWQQDHFVWYTTEPNDELKKNVEELLVNYALADGYTSEINLLLPAWIRSLAEVLKKGVMILFDYGYGRAEYYHPDRYMGTLMCYHQQQRHADPLVQVGAQDITAHVDFTSVVTAAVDANLELLGYTTQAAFLLSCNLIEISEEHPLSSEEQFIQGQMIKKLILPGEMGEAVKVMALAKEFDLPLLGFSLQDRSGDL